MASVISDLRRDDFACEKPEVICSERNMKIIEARPVPETFLVTVKFDLGLDS